MESRERDNQVCRQHIRRGGDGSHRWYLSRSSNLQGVLKLLQVEVSMKGLKITEVRSKRTLFGYRYYEKLLYDHLCVYDSAYR